MSEGKRFRNTLSDIEKGREQVRARQQELEELSDSQLRMRIAEGDVRVKRLIEQYVSPLIVDINESLANGKGTIRYTPMHGNSIDLPRKAWNSISWDVLGGTGYSYGEEYSYISAYKHLAFHMDEDGNISLHTPGFIEKDGKWLKADKDMPRTSVNIGQPQWETELRNQIAEAIRQGFHEWDSHMPPHFLP